MAKFAVGMMLFIVFSTGIAAPYEGKIIDANSSLDVYMKNPEVVLELMQLAGVSKTLLAIKGPKSRKVLNKFAKKHPDKIIPLLKASNKHYKQNTGKLISKLTKWSEKFRYGGLSELLLYTEYGSIYNEDTEPVHIRLSDDRVIDVVEFSRARGWPVILRLNLKTWPENIRKQYFSELDLLLTRYEDVNFVVKSLGQMEYPQITQLLQAHRNLYFDLAKTSPEHDDDKKIMIFEPYLIKPEDQGGLLPDWKQLMETYPQHFMIAYHNKGDIDWEKDFYLSQTAWWRKLLGELSPGNARLIAYKNAQRLWNIPE